MRIGKVLLPAVLLGIANIPGAAQQTPTSTAGDGQGIEVRLEPHEGKTQFTLGEPIRLDLVFTVNRPGFALYSWGDTSGEVKITPAEGWYRWHDPIGSDSAVAADLDSQPVREPLLLNDAFVFEKPGHYEVTVTTSRVGPSMMRMMHLALGEEKILPERRERTTNTVGIDLVAGDDQAEAALVRTLDSQLAGEPGKTREEAAERLAWLRGDDAVRAKVHWLLLADADNENTTNCDNVAASITKGLASSRNLQLQLDLLEAAWRDTARIPSGELQSAIENTRMFLRRQTLPEFGPVMAAPKTDPDTIRAQQEDRQDIEEVFASLAQRSGNNRAETAAFLFFQSGNLSAAEKAQVLGEVRQDFGELDQGTQTLLLETHWKQIKDPSAAQNLRDLLDAPDQEYVNRDALEKLIEVSPEAAGPYVVRAICEPNSDLPEKYAGKLPDETLPGVDGCLTTVLKQWTGKSDLWFREKVLFGARYGSAELLPLVRELYAARAGKFPRQHDGPFLAYLLRYAPQEAMPAIETLPGSDLGIAFMDIDRVFADRNAQFPPELLAWLRTETKSTAKSGNQAAWARMQLAQFGSDAERAQAQQETTP